MQALITMLILPLILLSFLGDIISGIWLAILGEWEVIGYGIVLLVFSPFVLSFVMMPAIMLYNLSFPLLEKRKTLRALPFVLLGQLYIYGLITGWCLFVLYFFLSKASLYTFWPLLIWSYGVALGPWEYMAWKEQQSNTGDASAMTTFFAQVSYLVIAILVAIGVSSLVNLAIVFGFIMLVGMVIQTTSAFWSFRGQ